MPLPDPGEIVAILIVILIATAVIHIFSGPGVRMGPVHVQVLPPIHVFGGFEIAPSATPDEVCERMGYEWGYTMGDPVDDEETWFTLHCGPVSNDTHEFKFPGDIKFAGDIGFGGGPE